MGVPRNESDAITGLPVPYPNSLIIGARQDPWIFVVKEDSPNVVQVPGEGEKALPRFVIPDPDLVVVTSRNEERLRVVEVYSTYWTIMLFEPVE